MGNEVWSVFAFFAAAPFALAGWIYCWYEAFRRLTPEGEAKGRQELWRYNGLYARRQDFTAAGWRFRWAAMVWPVLPGVAFVVVRLVVRA